jgi:hypothetical protein
MCYGENADDVDVAKRMLYFVYFVLNDYSYLAPFTLRQQTPETLDP